MLKEPVRRIVEGRPRPPSGSRDVTRAEARKSFGFDPPTSPAAHSERPSRASCASAESMPGEVRPFTAGR